MAVKEPRTKLVNFRLSEQEFLWLQQACSGDESRSISEYARKAVVNSINGRPAERQDVSVRLHKLDSQIHHLENSLALLLDRLNRNGNSAYSVASYGS